MALKTHFTRKEHSDSGLALLLITLILSFWVNQYLLAQIAIAEVLILLIAPVLIFPFTFLWLNLSELLGWVMSKLILFLVFSIFVVPVALFRRMLGKDSLSLKKFKRNSDSAFIDRNHNYTKIDLTTPY